MALNTQTQFSSVSTRLASLDNFALQNQAEKETLLFSDFSQAEEVSSDLENPVIQPPVFSADLTGSGYRQIQVQKTVGLDLENRN